MTDPFEEAARRYADEFASPEDLAALARARRDWRARQADVRTCTECGALMIGARDDAETCSGACRERKRYRLAQT